MAKLTFITSNQHKAQQLMQWLDYPIEHQALELEEIQSLNLQEIVDYKVRQAYEKMHSPVLVEDVSLSFDYLGDLPGPLIKWFVASMSLSQLCSLIPAAANRTAVARIMYALYDGMTIRHFSGEMRGSISDYPKGLTDFGWNAIFVPVGSQKTYGEMSEKELRRFSHRARAIEQLSMYLK